jgi:hypothetical protein
MEVEKEQPQSEDKQIPRPLYGIRTMGERERASRDFYFAKGHGFIRAACGHNRRRL